MNWHGVRIHKRIGKALRDWWARRREARIVRRYVAIGTYWGDTASYLYIGEPAGWGDTCKALERWEARYIALGYQPVPRRAWVEIGGYGAPVAPWLRLRAADHPFAARG